MLCLTTFTSALLLRFQQLAENPRPDGVVKMKGANDQYRIRIGDYRVRYEIDDKELIVLLLQCKHRRDVYRVAKKLSVEIQRLSMMAGDGQPYLL
nr:type II toxin-antitoxin system RelE/ParE family toxin [Leptolyngbya sp. FACHB-541]